jgi:hypothetical protein
MNSPRMKVISCNLSIAKVCFVRGVKTNQDHRLMTKLNNGRKGRVGKENIDQSLAHKEFST